MTRTRNIVLTIDQKSVIDTVRYPFQKLQFSIVQANRNRPARLLTGFAERTQFLTRSENTVWQILLRIQFGQF